MYIFNGEIAERRSACGKQKRIECFERERLHPEFSTEEFKTYKIIYPVCRQFRKGGANDPIIFDQVIGELIAAAEVEAQCALEPFQARFAVGRSQDDEEDVIDRRLRLRKIGRGRVFGDFV